MVRSRFNFVASLFLFLGAVAHADFRVDVAEAPMDNLALTVSAIQSAQQSIYLNIYELTSSEIADALINRIQAGVHVEILEEGQPVGGMSAAAKGVQSQIVQAMQQTRGGNHFYVMTSKGTASKRRYRFDHAKYAVIDDSNLLIGSENYSPTGNPSPGTKGNRGWEVMIHDASIAAEYKNVFSGDAVTNFGDVEEASSGMLEAARKPGSPSAPPTPPKANPAPTPGPVPPSGPSQGQGMSASAVSRITSPDTSLSGLVGLIDQARTSIDIQQMTFDSSWSGGTNPLVSALERAAARGVHIRVLLNDEAVFNHGKPAPSKNLPTISHLSSLPNTQARTANLKGMGVDYIHNKGMLIDGQITLISSINWDENAIQHNREAAVAITSPAVFTHYDALFESDWQVSGNSVPALEMRFPVSVAQAISEPVKDCPASLRVTARIGKLTLDGDDSSFGSIDGATIAQTYVRERSSDGCVLSSEDGIGGLSRRSFVEIRASRGDTSLTLEGYTPRGAKIYSVRAKIPKEAALSGNFDANVFNGSAAHEFLGRASLEIEAVN